MAPSTVVPSNGPPSAFSRSLEEFRRRLSAEDRGDFEITTYESLELAIKDIQKDQAQRRALRHLNKIQPFLRFLQDYARVIEQFVSAKPDFLTFIWGPIKLCLQIASRLNDAFDALLNAYARIGEALPIFSAIDGLLASRSHGHTQQILANVYDDILTFHKRAVVFFKQPGWSPIVPHDAYSIGLSMEDNLSHYYPLIRRPIRGRSQEPRKVQRVASPKRKYLAISGGPGYSVNHHSTVRSPDGA